ncbi:MAG: helix-turn-helix transcriptional regulator [Bacteroidales bacterium]
MGDIKKNRNLFRYIYYDLSKVSYLLGDYQNAYDYLRLAHDLLNHFYHERIQSQINEMSAKYDLQEKEAKIREEKQKNKTYRLQKSYLTIIAIILVVLTIIVLILLRFKNKAYKKLVDQSMKSLKIEKELEKKIINSTTFSITDKANENEKFSVLAERLNKYLVEKKPYLRPEVNMDDFCRDINTNRSYLSKLLNESMKISFNDLLTDFRVRTARELLADTTKKHLSIDGIRELSGFKSNTTFNRTFKQQVGVTPSIFRLRAVNK